MKAAQFYEWLQTFRYTGTVTYGSATFHIGNDDVNRLLAQWDNQLDGLQKILDQGHCNELRQALAYVRLIEQASISYSTYGI